MEVSSPLAPLIPPLERFLAFLSEEPVARALQALLMGGASLLIFLVFFATRDILRRTQSLLAQLGCILLVAALPVVGFLLYLLIRPARTLKEKEMEEVARESLMVLKELIEKIPSKFQAPIPKSRLIAHGTGRVTDTAVAVATSSAS